MTFLLPVKWRASKRLTHIFYQTYILRTPEMENLSCIRCPFPRSSHRDAALPLRTWMEMEIAIFFFAEIIGTWKHSTVHSMPAMVFSLRETAKEISPRFGPG